MVVIGCFWLLSMGVVIDMLLMNSFFWLVVQFLCCVLLSNVMSLLSVVIVCGVCGVCIMLLSCVCVLVGGNVFRNVCLLLVQYIGIWLLIGMWIGMNLVDMKCVMYIILFLFGFVRLVVLLVRFVSLDRNGFVMLISVLVVRQLKLICIMCGVNWQCCVIGCLWMQLSFLSVQIICCVEFFVILVVLVIFVSVIVCCFVLNVCSMLSFFLSDWLNSRLFD